MSTHSFFTNASDGPSGAEGRWCALLLLSLFGVVGSRGVLTISKLFLAKMATQKHVEAVHTQNHTRIRHYIIKTPPC